MRSLTTVREDLGTNPQLGLDAATIEKSSSRYGVNKLTPLPREPVWKKFLEKFDEPIIQILLAASLLKLVVDLFAQSPLAGGIALGSTLLLLIALPVLQLRAWLPTSLFTLAMVLVGVSAVMGHPSYEGLAVMIAVALATGVSFLSEYRSDREFDKLNAGKEAARVKVRRSGVISTISLDEVLVGDVVILEGGDEIPADGRVLQANELQIDQSLMTGESEPVKKLPEPESETNDGPDRSGCLYRGTHVLSGLGEMMVTNVGDDTMLGQIARKLSSDDGAHAGTSQVDERISAKLTISKHLTPLQLKLADLAKLISKVGYLAAVLIFLALLIRGLFFSLDPVNGKPEVFWPTSGDETLLVAKNLLSYVVYMVIVIVVAVPEGLPMSVTVSLALAMQKMTRANALVRQLVATETIGSATVICSDKTGTMTLNQMLVDRIVLPDEVLTPNQPVTRSPHSARSALEMIVANALLNSTASLENKEGKLLVVGSSTEGALLRWLHDHSVTPDWFAQPTNLLFRLAFSSEQKSMTSVVRLGDSTLSLVKGAPEFLLKRSTHYLDADGRARPLTSGKRAEIETALAAASEQAMRTLGFAYADLNSDSPDAYEPEALAALPLTWCGFAAIRDPLRPEVPDALAQCRAAGIEVIMITGDNDVTAKAIARDAGLFHTSDHLALTSEEFNKMTDDEVRAILPRLRVLARARPLDKYRLVGILQSQNHVVAVTGDGTNDAPSLKKADVGLAMGNSGTEVAKEASKIVLLDDSFTTIVKAVHWGRALYENIQRFIQFQLTINVSALVITFLGPFLGLKPPFTVLQLLWINVIMDTFAAIALCSEPPRPGVMRQKPKRRDESIINRPMLRTILSTSLFYVVVMIGLLMGMQSLGWFGGGESRSAEFPELTLRQVTIFFTTYVFFQIWNQINCRSITPDRSGLAGLFRNPIFLGIASLTLIGQIIIVHFGGMIFEVEPLAVQDWLVIAGATSSVIVFAEFMRVIARFGGTREGTA